MQSNLPILTEALALHGYGQPLVWGDTVEGHGWPFVIVVPPAERGLILYLADTIEQFLRQPVIVNSPFESFDISILLQLSGLNVFNPYSLFASLGLHNTTDVCWSAVVPNQFRLAAIGDDLFQRPNQSLYRHFFSSSSFICDRIEAPNPPNLAPQE